MSASVHPVAKLEVEEDTTLDDVFENKLRIKWVDGAQWLVFTYKNRRIHKITYEDENGKQIKVKHPIYRWDSEADQVHVQAMTAFFTRK